MREELFWELIEVSRSAGRRKQAASLYRMLHGSPPEAIAAFARTQRRMMRRLCTPDVLAACFIVLSYTSDDVFEDFTAWIVAQGRRDYEAIRRSTAHLATILKRKEVDGLDWTFTWLAGKVYEDKTGRSLPVSERLPDIPITWPKTLEGYARRWPELARAFLNPKRIREIHAFPR